jgi:tRNA (mo5U34)-methyltransferase
MPDLSAIKRRVWFYEFELPDGSVTQTDIPPEVRAIHSTRRDMLRRVLHTQVPDATELTAIDLASHEGFFSLELSRHFRSVHGIEIRPESLDAAREITGALGARNIRFTQGDLQKMEFDPAVQADFVLLYGLLYHVENPIHLLRLASQMSRRHILVETQIFPYDISGPLEDGHYVWQRDVHGVFSLSVDYPTQREGGSTDVALVPSLNALMFMLRNFGFTETFVLPAEPNEYEQFRRRSRVVVYGRK